MLASSNLLRGTRVLDFTWVAAGPSGTLLLTLSGADVIKVESRARLDNYRQSFGIDGDVDRSLLFAAVNMGKRSITVDAKSGEGTEVLLALVEQCDVVVENFSPGTMERLGLGFESMRQRNPGLVMVSSSAAGQSGPKRSYAGFASIFAAQGGLTASTLRNDGTPARFGRSLDSRVGTAVAVATLVGLLIRRSTGSGCHLDVSGQEVVAALLGDVLIGATPDRPAGQCLRCQDGWVFVESPAASATEGVDLPPGQRDRLERECADVTADEAIGIVERAGLLALRVASLADLADNLPSPLVAPWGLTDHRLLGQIVSLGSPVVWPSAVLSNHGAAGAPLLGEHTEEILSSLVDDRNLVERARAEGTLR